MGGNETHGVRAEGVPEGLLTKPPDAASRDARAQQTVEREMTARARDMQHQFERVNEAFVAFVSERPMVALAGAVGVGYLLGRMLRRVV